VAYNEQTEIDKKLQNITNDSAQNLTEDPLVHKPV